MRPCLILTLCLLPYRLLACEVALVLAVDVSGSVDAQEYKVQMHGLARALRDGAVAEALVKGRAQVALVQWTGHSRQQVTVPWREIRSFADNDTLADDIDRAPRVWRHFSTAIGEALRASAELFEAVPTCRRRVIDLSSDGSSNEGPQPVTVRPLLARRGIIVNGLVIEGAEDRDLTAYFFENVIFGPGAFVVSAGSYAEYPDRIRQKFLRELTKQTAAEQVER